MFGSVPYDLLIEHDWENDVVKIGEVPASFVNKVSEGLINESIPVEVNRLIMDDSYDLIISIGQVVPHEVVGMANYSKNIFVAVVPYNHKRNYYQIEGLTPVKVLDRRGNVIKSISRY